MTAYADDNEGYFDHEKWYAVMEIYQMPGFNGVPSGVGFISSIGGPLGRIVLGDPVGSESDHPRPLITISDMMFNIPFSEPTCILTAPTTVNLGDWYRSDSRKIRPPKCLFRLPEPVPGRLKSRSWRNPHIPMRIRTCSPTRLPATQALPRLAASV